jgi:hypothetical protein
MAGSDGVGESVDGRFREAGSSREILGQGTGVLRKATVGKDDGGGGGGGEHHDDDGSRSGTKKSPSARGGGSLLLY